MTRLPPFLPLLPLLAACAAPPLPSLPGPTVAASVTASSPSPVAAAPSPPPPEESVEVRAARLHREAIVVDTHDDITSAILDDGFDLGRPDGHAATDLVKMRAGGIGAEFFSIYVDTAFYDHPTARKGGAARRALDMIDATYQQLERHGDALELALGVDDIRRARRDGKVAVLMGIEGGHAIENSLRALREFHRLGVRYMTLTHTSHNDWADSSGFLTPLPPRHHGLTPFGEEVVREMQRIGMLVDVSHVSDATFDAVIRLARAPVIASHSSARALCPAPRNLSDEQLRALGRNGGVAMVNFYSAFLDPAYQAAARAFWTKHAAELAALDRKHATGAERARAMDAMGHGDLPHTPLSVLVDHIAHIAQVAGVDHVGLGSDFDGVDAMPDGLSGMDGLPRITLELVKRGFSDEDVKKILGENFLRVMSAAEAFARSTGTSRSGDGSTRAIDP